MLTDHGVVAREAYGMSRNDLAERLKITFQDARAGSPRGGP